MMKLNYVYVNLLHLLYWTTQFLMKSEWWNYTFYLKRRPPTQEEQEHLDFFFHNGEIHPGVATSNKDVNQRQYYVFYQWVCFVIFIQVQ